ncbi:MAG: helix-turn-helix transcriptional regulator [Phycisphaerales bacterium]|nr:helix-turn-helix transcriptional regulator [Phycisphaerales bacterium]
MGDFQALVGELAWAALVEDSGCIVSILDAEGRWCYANEPTARFVGRPVRELIGHTLMEMLPEDFAEERMHVIRRVIETGETVRLVTRLMGGRLDCVYRPLRDHHGAIRYVLATGSSGVPSAQGKDDDHTGSGPVVEISTPGSAKLDSLTPREREVLRMIGEGLTTAQIATRLFRTIKTVEAHRASLGRKLGVTNRVQLAHIAIQAGLVANPGSEHPFAGRVKKSGPGQPIPDEQG